MKITKEDFKRFKKECIRLQGLLNLRDWTIYYSHKKIDKAVAISNLGNDSNVAYITLNTDTEDTPFCPEETARHEMSHLFIWRFRRLILSENKPTDNEIMNTFEDIAIVMEKLNITESSQRAEL